MEVETVANTSESTEKIRQKGKTVRTLLIIGLVLVVISSPLWLCGGCATITALLPGAEVDDGPRVVNDEDGQSTNDSASSEESDEESAEVDATADVFRIGDEVQLGNYIMKVAAIEDPYVSTNQFEQPDEGSRFVAVDVVYKNSSSGSTVSYNPNDWSLFDSEGYSFSYSWMADKEPSLSSGTLNPGGTVRGWMTFEVPDSSTNFRIQFTPSWLSDENIEFHLY